MSMQVFLDGIAHVWRPHRGQEEFLLAEASTKVLACGRRWGKTDVCAIQIIAEFERQNRGRQLIVAPTLDQSRIVFERVLELFEAIHHHLPKVSFSPYPRLRFDQQELVARSGHVPRLLRGQEATHIVVDEAAFVDDRLIQDTLSPMLATTEGRLTLASTPQGFNLFWRYFDLGKRREHAVWSRQAPTQENPRVSRDFLAVQRETISERTYRVEYGAEFLDDEGAVFRSEAIDAAQIASLGDLRGPFYAGLDWARYTDYTVLVVLAGTRERAAIVELKRLPQIGWFEQVEILAQSLRRYPDIRVLADGNSMGDAAADIVHRVIPGLALERFGFNQQSKAGLIEGLVSMFERQAIQFRPDPLLIRELRAFRYRNGKLDGGSEHDDVVIALALAAHNLPTTYENRVWLGDSR